MANEHFTSGYSLFKDYANSTMYSYEKRMQTFSSAHRSNFRRLLICKVWQIGTKRLVFPNKDTYQS